MTLLRKKMQHFKKNSLGGEGGVPHLDPRVLHPTQELKLLQVEMSHTVIRHTPLDMPILSQAPQHNVPNLWQAPRG